MLKFFRLIRRRLIRTGELQKYLLYALGEIVLVVVGILIALSINNRNTEKLERKDEQKIYSNIQKKILRDKTVLARVMDYNNDHMEQYQYAISVINANDRTQLDSLIRIAPKLWRYSDFNGSSNIYQNLVNSGELKILQNNEIVEALQALEESYIYMNRLETNHFNVILRFVGPGVIDNIDFSNGEIDRPEELYSFVFKNQFFSFISICEEKHQIYQNALTYIDRISEMIDEEIGRSRVGPKVSAN